MVGWIAAAMGLVISMTVGAGLADAQDNEPRPSDATASSDSAAGLETEGHVDAEDVELEGTLHVMYEDREDGSRLHRSLLTRDGQWVSLDGVRHRDLVTGDLVRVRGVRWGGKLRVQADAMETESGTAATEALQVLEYAPLADTFGPQKVAVILVNFTNDQSKPFTASDMRYWMELVDDFYVVNSYGQTSVSFGVFGWYTLPITNAGCPTSSIQVKADQAAAAAGVNVGAYERRVYVFPHTTSCGWGGLGTVGGYPSYAWINGATTGPSVIRHELGHNLGLYHSHSMSCAPAILAASCTTSEYGDITDTMGGGGGPFNVFQKERLGWLGYGASPPMTVVTTSGTYQLGDNESLGTTPKGLRIQRGTGSAQAFYVELHTPAPGRLPPGVYVHLATGSADGYLLDMTPATPFYPSANLAAGQSFTDPVSRITIRTIAETNTGATIQVDIPGTAPSCTSSPAAVTASPAQGPVVQPGTAVTYTVTVRNADSAGCAPAAFLLQASVPAGWQSSFAAPTLTISPGGTVSTTLRIASSPTAAAGAYPIVSTAINNATATVSSPVSAVYNVAAITPGPVAPGMFADQFDRADAPDLGNGWVQATGSLGVRLQEARSPVTGGVNLAVRPELVGATQTVQMSFASTNNNTSPRFGVVLRYQDAKNYYLCYRQVGGASVVRVAKVQNGVETVLKSAAVPNPAVNSFSTVSCQADGSTITLALDGAAKLQATDTTFSRGSAGYRISSLGAASHRADDFSATVR